MQLRLVPQLSRCVHECQRFCEYRQSSFWLSHHPMCFGEEREPIRSHHLCACSPKGSRTLDNLLDPCLRLSLLCECPAAQDRTLRYPDRKTLFRGKGDCRFGAFLGATHLAAELMKHSSSTQ